MSSNLHPGRYSWVILFSLLVFVSLVSTGANAGAVSFSETGQSQQPTVTVTDAAVDPDKSTAVELRLSHAPDGLSGYTLTLTVKDGAVAAITDASYPDGFELSDDPRINAANTTVRLKAVDLQNPPGPDATDVLLATVTLKGKTAGTTALTIDVEQMDDDDGGRIQPTTDSGTLTVGDATPSSTSTSTPTSTQPPTETDTPTPTQPSSPTTESESDRSSPGGQSPTEAQTPTLLPTATEKPAETSLPQETPPVTSAPAPGFTIVLTMVGFAVAAILRVARACFG